MTFEELKIEADKFGYDLVKKTDRHTLKVKRCPMCGKLPHIYAGFSHCDVNNEKEFNYLYPDGHLVCTRIGFAECRKCKTVIKTYDDEWFRTKALAENAVRRKWNKYVEYYELFTKGDNS